MRVSISSAFIWTVFTRVSLLGLDDVCHAVHVPRRTFILCAARGVKSPVPVAGSNTGDEFAIPYPASNSLILSSRNVTSAGLYPGPPAKCPQIDGIGTSSAFGMFATSISLSATGK